MKVKNRFLRFLLTLLSLLFWIAVWHFAAKRIQLSLVLPTPREVFLRLWELAGEKSFYDTLFSSFLRILTGFSGGAIAGFLLGMIAHYCYPVKALFSPLMAMIKATPVASFILLVILWIDKETTPAFISFLMVLPILWQNTLLAFEKRDGLLIEMGKVYGLSPWKRFARISLPQILPFVFAASKTSLGLAWKAGVAAEVLALPKASVGYMIYNAKMYLETTDLYAWTVAIILVSVLPECLFSLFYRKKGEQHDSH